MQLQLKKQLRQIAWELWDPIGLSRRPAGWPGRIPDDEYDSYLAKAAEMLEGDCCVEEVISYFFLVQSVSMGVPPTEMDDITHEKLGKLVTAIRLCLEPTV